MPVKWNTKEEALVIISPVAFVFNNLCLIRSFVLGTDNLRALIAFRSRESYFCQAFINPPLLLIGHGLCSLLLCKSFDSALWIAYKFV